MNSDLPPVSVPPAQLPPENPTPQRRRWWLYGCGLVVALVLVIVATVAITIWWIQRPIKPVVLSSEERAVVEKKLQPLEAASKPPEQKIELDRPYVPGSKVLRLTERELNGLLNENTDLGKTVRLELGRDAINAYLATRIPEDVPIFGGKMFRARGRFHVVIAKGTPPSIVLEDVTVFGLSLPKAWLGGLKGENLLADVVSNNDGTATLRGVKSLRVEPGAIVLEVED